MQELTSQSFKLFVGGLPFSVTKKTLFQRFIRYGEITKSVVIRCPKTKRSKGFGFVFFKQGDSLEKALDEPIYFSDKLVDCYVSEAKGTLKSKAELEMERKVFVGGLPISVDKSDLEQHFSKIGKVTDVRVIYDGRTLVSRGFGFVSFELKEAAIIAINNPQVFEGLICKCRPFEQKKAQELENESKPKKLTTDISTTDDQSNSRFDIISEDKVKIDQPCWSDEVSSSFKLTGFSIPKFTSLSGVASEISLFRTSVWAQEMFQPKSYNSNIQAECTEYISQSKHFSPGNRVLNLLASSSLSEIEKQSRTSSEDSFTNCFEKTIPSPV